MTINKQTQCTLLLSASDRWTIEMFELDPKSVRYYTGLDDYNHFNLVYQFAWTQHHLMCPTRIISETRFSLPS